MADRSVAVVLSARVQGVVAGFQTAGRAVEDFGRRTLESVGRNQAHIQNMALGIGLFGVAAVGAAGLAVRSFAAFDEQMSAVQAATHESVAGMAALRDAALEAGQRTRYSASEAAGAIEELAKAGVSTADILDGGLDGALDLAAAGALDVSEAAGIASVALKQFGLRGQDVSHVSDLLAAGAGKAMGDVTDLGMALRQTGQVANSAGLSIEETTAGLSAFASAGLLGSDAGTSFKAMLQRLTPQSAEAQAKMDELGISAYDASGNFIGLAELSGNLQRALRDLTPEQRNSALATIFGSDAVRAATVLYDEGESGIRDWIEAVDDQGYAAETAAIRMDNLKGDVEQFGGAMENALINAGESADGPLRSLVQGATDVVNAFSEAGTGVQGVTLAIVGGAGLVALGLAGLGKLAIGINDTREALNALGVSGKKAGLAVGVVGSALSIAAIGLTVWAQGAAEAKARTEELQQTLDQFGNVTDDTLSDINNRLSKNNFDWFDRLFFADYGSAIDQAEKMGLAIRDLQTYIVGTAEQRDEVDAMLLHFDAVNNSAAGSTLRAQLEAERSALTEAQRAQAQKALADQEAGVASDDAASAYGRATAAIEEQVQTLGDLIAAQREAGGVVLSVRDAQRGLEQSSADVTAALEENGATLDITTEAGRRNQEALDGVASAGWDLIESMEANGATQEELQGVMATTRDRFVNAATAMGMGADEAGRLADELGLIPANVATRVTVDTNDAYAEIRALRDEASRVIQMRVNVNPSYDPARTVNNVARAAGGPVTGRRRYLVGENGPELFEATQTGSITNAAATRTLANTEPPRLTTFGYSPGSGAGGSPSGPSFSVSVNAEAGLASQYAERVAERTTTRLRDLVAVHGLG